MFPFFESFTPHLPTAHRDTPYVLLANIAPSLQHHVLDQMRRPKFIVAHTLIGKGIPEVEGTYKAHGEAGAKFVVNTKTDGWVKKVREITSGNGVDLAFDPVAGPELERIAQTMRQEGVVFEYGALSLEPTPFPLFAAIGNSLTIRGFSLFSIVTNPERSERSKRWIFDQLAAGKLKRSEGIIHFAVPTHHWWDNIGYT